jgi:hypothetical protein
VKYYTPISTIEVIADNLFENKQSQKIILYCNIPICIIYKQKDLFDETIEHWTTKCGWTLKIQEADSKNLKENTV